MIVSVHLPKTAGTSFRSVLEIHFGSSLMHDYGDLPINTDVFTRNRAALNACVKNGDYFPTDTACVHGHFLPLKYLLLSTSRRIKFITWMRNPVERLLSHYYFWKRRVNPPMEEELLRKIHIENWSVEKFCFSAELQNTYGQFLWGFPLELFDFIGITEYYAEDLHFFSQNILNCSSEVTFLNVNERASQQYDIDPSFRKDIEVFHDRDMKLYRAALNLRLERMSQFKNFISG